MDDPSSEEHPLLSFVFITGFTSNPVAQVVVFHLLRYFPSIRLYILSRSKAAVSAVSRVRKVLDPTLHHFSKLGFEIPDLSERLTIVEGNLFSEDLRLSDSDADLVCQNTNFVVHCAESADLNQSSLQRTTKINFCGTSNILKFAKKCKNLKVFAFLSSAYVASVNSPPGSSIYGAGCLSPIDPDSFLDHFATPTSNIDDPKISNFISKFPNPFLFSKFLCEAKLMKESTTMGGVPFSLAIIRPTILSPSHSFPYPGWFNNNPIGSFPILIELSSGNGISHLIGTPDGIIDLIPVDFVAKTLIGAIFNQSRVFREIGTPPPPLIVQIGTSSENPVSLRNLQILVQRHAVICRKKSEWSRPRAPILNLIGENAKMNFLDFYLSSELPLTILKTLCPKHVSVKLENVKAMEKHKQIKIADQRKFFTSQSWTFQTDALRDLLSNFRRGESSVASSDHRQDFDSILFSLQDLDWDEYIQNCALRVVDFLIGVESAHNGL